MIITVTIVAVMKVTIYEIAGVIAVLDRFVTTVFSVHVAGIVSGASVSAEAMLIYMIAMLVMDMSIMKVVNVVAVLYSGVSAGAGMFVIVFAVCLTVAH